MSVLNVAVWGLGNHAKNRIIPTLYAMDEITLLGVCSRNRKSVLESAKQWGCLGWFTPEEMLNRSDLDVVYISSPIGLHFVMASQSLNAGKHVWCEKPLTCDFNDTKKLILLAEKRNKAIVESFMYLYHSQFAKVKHFVNQSREVNSIICRFGIPVLEKPGFRNDPKLCGGAFWDVGSYTISAILALFPDHQVSIQFSEISQKPSSKVDSDGRVILRFSNGVIAYLEWAVGVAYKNELDVWTRDGSLFTEKIFSKPKNYKPLFYIRDLHGKVSMEYGEESEQFVKMFQNYVQMLGNEQKIYAERKVILDRARLMDQIINNG